MDSFLLDTDVFSFLAKARDTRGDAYRPYVEGKTVAVSFITVGEIYFGAGKKGWSSKTLSAFLERLKAVVVVPSDHDVCRVYGQLRAGLQKAGIVVGDNDLWIAACAVRHSITLISNNRKHFEKIPGLQLISLAPESPGPKAKGLFETGSQE
jgi:tRNA(fMet)-specific endonuclease VapC